MANRLLTGQAASRGLDRAVPCWSHHFDMALVAPVPRPDAQVTLGFSPGDDTIPEPYFYVLAWPLPADLSALPDAPHPGRWQRDGWTGLALPGSLLLAARGSAGPGGGDTLDAPAQAFFDGGFDIARSLSLAA